MVGRREEILDAAVAIADERGIEAVSMRAVAERVGVTPMALYSHVGDKTGLLDAMNGWVLAKLAKSPRSTDPWQRLFDFARASRRLTHRHPWAAQLLLSRPVNTAEGVSGVDEIWVALLEIGVPPSDVPRVERMLSTFVVGFAASEAGGRFRRLNPRGRRDQTTGQTLPGHAAVADRLGNKTDWDAEFDADLDDLRRLVETVVARAGYAR